MATYVTTTRSVVAQGRYTKGWVANLNALLRGEGRGDGLLPDKTASALLSGRKALNGWLYIGSDVLVFIGAPYPGRAQQVV